ncbi:uncharacterized protein LOC123705482 [Colias croceus]|uniref:uncharacterized protein LOC123705482 n=1 Tax=Colias crocea TaxID=72248 RepID=UPI001E2812FC|nr:uncharacterized protein LOC123705482 [Colias croceus]
MSLRATRCCSHCKASCQSEFKQVVNLKMSGLLIYVYNNVDPIISASGKNVRSVVIHNIGNKEIKKIDYVVELCQYKTKCYQCEKTIQCIRNLLDNVNIIRKNEVLAVCEHCKRSNFKNKCKRCLYLLEKFITCRVKQNESRLDAYRSWWCSAKHLLQTFVQNQNIICGNRLSFDESSEAELKKLVSLIKSSSPTTSPCIDNISLQAEFDKSTDSMLEVETNNKVLEMMDDLSICKEVASAEEETPCMCRYFVEHKKDFQPKVSLEMPVIKHMPCPPCAQKKTLTPQISITKPVKKGTKTSPKTISDDRTILRLIKERKTKKKQEKPGEIVLPQIDSLPALPKAKKQVVSEDSESILECAPEHSEPNEMIRGTKIVHLDPHYKMTKPSMEPLVFRKQYNFAIPDDEAIQQMDATPLEDLKEKPSKDTKGIIRYELSNREFIDKGWTKLPTIKIMRKMNIYKMIPAYPQFDWFKNHRKERVLFYDTGEVLAELYENGCGKWFYKNGLIALDFFNSEDINVKQRYIIYGNNDEYKFNTKRPITVLACFDHLGHGIVYDHTGKVRLKYNQSEGIIIDEKIAPPSRWKWHTLNEPPVFENAYIDNKVKVNEVQRNLLSPHLLDTEENEKPINEEMLVIEFENFVKAKAAKMLQQFKPFQIRMKVVKINDFFSLRVIDQANIYILFRTGHISLKLNIGMHLKSDEIIDTEIVEISEVSTPYDSNMSISKSVTEIHKILENANHFYKSRK